MRRRHSPDAQWRSEGPDGPVRRTYRTPPRGGESYEQERPVGRNQAMIDEESAWLHAAFMESEAEE